MYEIWIPESGLEPATIALARYPPKIPQLSIAARRLDYHKLGAAPDVLVILLQVLSCHTETWFFILVVTTEPTSKETLHNDP